MLEYGEGCQDDCGHCADSACDPVSGICVHGCQSGWQDILCKTRKRCDCTILYSHFMPVLGMRCRGQLDALLPEVDCALSRPRHRRTVVLSIPPNSHEITVLLPKKCRAHQSVRQDLLAYLARDVGSRWYTHLAS